MSYDDWDSQNDGDKETQPLTMDNNSAFSNQSKGYDFHLEQWNLENECYLENKEIIY